MHPFLKRTFVFLLMILGFLPQAFAQTAELAEGYYRIVSRRNNFPICVKNQRLGYLSEHSGSGSEHGDDLSSYWKVKRVNGAYWIVNVGEQLPIQPLDRLNETFIVGTMPAHYYIKKASGSGSADYWVVSTTENFQGKTLWHNGNSGLVQNWEDANSEANHWQFVSLTAEEKKGVAQFETSWPKLEKNLLQLEKLREGGLYRVKNASNRYWTVDQSSHALKTTTEVSKTDFSTLWLVERSGDGFAIRNAGTSRFVPQAEAKKNVTTSTGSTRLWVNFFKTTPDFFNISANKEASVGTCLEETNGNALVGGNAQTFTTKTNAETNKVDTTFQPNTAAEWQFVAVNDVSEEDVKAAIRQNSNGVYEPVEGKYYIVRNVAYPDRVLTTLPASDDVVRGAVRNEREMGQVWQLEKKGEKWAIRSVASQKYVGNSAARSQNYMMTTNSAEFTLKHMDKWLPNIAFVVNSSASLHCASSAGYNVVNWDETATASQWQLEEITFDPAALATYKQKLQEQKNLTANREQLNVKLQKYFTDFACTQLRSTYQSMSDEALKSVLTTDQMPQSLIDMVLRVKTGKWNKENAEANSFEKRFRIQNYQAYSHPQKWANDLKLMPTNFGQYSQLTNPTGVTIPEKEMVLVFVGDDAPANCELNAELVQGKNKTGDRLIQLRKGLNAIYANENSHLYINYVINDVNLKYTDQPRIPIHVEGGRANGFFDANTMTNADWDKLVSLKSQGFFNDEVIRLKSKHTIHSLSLSGVEEQQKAGNWEYNGEYKGITGVLGKWDDVHDLEQDFFSPKQFEGRFNCLMFSTDASGLYAFPYGTFIGTVSTTFSYKEWAKGSPGDNAGNLWAVVHETGHHYQKLFNLARCLESSNNLWSNIAVWKRGASVSRLDAPQKLFDRFNRDQSWFDMDLGDRSRMYWQLWLYYVELGKKPTFFHELFEKFRKDPIDSRNAKTDYLRFARFCSEVAQEDLTEFFTFYGFFKKTGENLPLKYNDGFYDRVYAPATISVSQADIDECKTEMSKYSKKANNLLFIDERIRQTPATFEGHKPGDVRWATIGGLNPGDSRVFGDGGHYTDFGTKDQPGTTAQPKAVQWEERTIRIEGTGAVGYKVYDAQGKLVMVANRHAFTIPAQLDLSQIKICVAGGDGGEVEIYKDGKILPAYDKPLSFDNPVGLTVSTGTKNPFGKYIIRNYRVYNGKYYYADEQSRPTANQAEAGEFIFVGGKNSGDYHLYSLKKKEWATYSNVRDGKNRVSWTKDFAQSQPWHIEHVLNGATSYYNILPAGSQSQGWNWHGGVDVSHNSVGFYSKTDANSHWEFIPADLITKYLALVKHADSIMVRDTDKALSTKPYHDAFRTHLAGELARTAVTQADFDTLNAKLAAWEVFRAAGSTLVADGDGVQNVRPFLNDFKSKLSALNLSSANGNSKVDEVKSLLEAWKTWKKADEVLQRDADKVKKSTNFYNAFKAVVNTTSTSNATAADHIADLQKRMELWPVWRGADSLVQIPPYGDPLNTKFREPFSKLIEKDYTQDSQVPELKEYGRYFRMLVTADSLLSLTNPGYPLAKFKGTAGLETDILQPAAAEPQPNFDDWEWALNSIVDWWAGPANLRTVKTDEEAYYMPEDGNIYRLRSYLDHRYMTSEPAWSAHDGKTADVSLSRKEDNSTLWVLQQNKNGDKYLAPLSGKGYLARMPTIAKGGLVDTPAPLSFGTARHIEVNGRKQQKMGTLYIRNNGLSFVGWTNDNAIGGHSGTEANPVWHDGGNTGSTSFYFDTVKEATFPVTTLPGSNGNYATLHLPFAVELPTGLTAYLVKNITDKEAGNVNGDKVLCIEPIQGNVLPANTPVILGSAEAKTFQLRPTKWSEPQNSLLKGTNLRIEAQARSSAGQTYYGLTRDADTQEFLFRRIRADVAIPGNRAFLTLPTSIGHVRSFILQIVAKPTSVENVTTAPKTENVYNLSGQRVNASTTKGIVISKGKKMILR